MPSTSETGHAKNVANFQDLIAFCTTLGADYNPSKSSLKLTSLTSSLASAEDSLSAAKQTEVAYNNANNLRQQAFKPLKSLGTKIVNAVAASDITAELLKDAKTINRKLQGTRATPKAEGEKSNSASQQSYDQQVEHFAKLVELLKSQSGYNPNEAGLSLASLQSTLAGIKAANTDLSKPFTEWANSRGKRNEILYSTSTGLVDTGLNVKAYIKSIYGASSPQYKQANKISFRNVN